MRDKKMHSFFLKYAGELKTCLDRFDFTELVSVSHSLLKAYEQDKQIFVMGNGGSGTTASHFCCDINKSLGFSRKKRFRVVCLNDNISTVTAYANDISYEDIFSEQLKKLMLPGDVALGISSKGNSINIVKAMEYANSRGGTTIGLTGSDGGKLKKISALSLVVPSHDTQKIEDIHLCITHMIMQIMSKSCG